MSALAVLADWPVSTAAAAVVGPAGVLATHGDTDHAFGLASVTKPLVARAAQVAVEEGVFEMYLPAEQVDHAMERFRSTRRDEGGTGLGLPIAEHIIVNDHGGELAIDSVPGEGTKVVVMLPLRHAPREGEP